MVDPDLYEIGTAIDLGKKRKSGANQDSLIVLTSDGPALKPILLVIADGMGGYTGGAIASETITSLFSSFYREHQSESFDMQGFSTKVINESLLKMQQKAKDDPQLANMGSTLVAVSMEKTKVTVVNVGDSRAYLFHAGDIKQISYDHSFIGEAMRSGLITPLQALNHPKRNQLTQSISARRKEVKPYFGEHALERDDVLLLCTDGLWGVVSEAIMQAVVLEMPPQAAAEKLVKLANSRGGPDNISVIICRRVDSVPVLPQLNVE